MQKSSGTNSVTVQELLTVEPFVNCAILGGWSGKHKPIEHIVALQEYKDGRTIQRKHLKNCLVAVSGCDNEDYTALDSMLSSKLSGILFYGDKSPRLSGELLAQADQKNIPLVFLAEQNIQPDIEATLKFLTDLKVSGRFLDVAKGSCSELFPGKSNKEILVCLQKLVGNPVSLVNKVFQVFDSSSSDQILAGIQNTTLIGMVAQKEKGAAAKEAKKKITVKCGTVKIDNRTTNYICIPLWHENILYGHLLGFEVQSIFSDVDNLLLCLAGRALLQELININKILDIEKKYKSDFIHDLLYFNFTSKEEVVNRGKLWGYDLLVPHQLMVIEPDSTNHVGNHSEAIAKLHLIINKTVNSYPLSAPPMISDILDQVVVITPVQSANMSKNNRNIVDLAQRIQKQISENLPKVSVSVGIGKNYGTITDIGRSYQEAKIALQLGRFIEGQGHITRFEDLGIINLLTAINFQRLDDYYKEYLGGLIQYDEKNKANLLQTLQIFFQQNGDVNMTADKLFLHPNTLRYRLNKIEEITELSLQKYDNLFNLYVACKIAKMRSGGLGSLG